MSTLPDPVDLELDDSGNADCPGDELVDWSRVDKLPARIAQVVDVDSALTFYDELAGHEVTDG